MSRVTVRSTPCRTTRSGMPSFAQPATSSKAGPTMRTRCPPLTRQRCDSTARQYAPMSVTYGDGASGIVRHALSRLEEPFHFATMHRRPRRHRRGTRAMRQCRRCQPSASTTELAMRGASGPACPRPTARGAASGREPRRATHAPAGRRRDAGAGATRSRATTRAPARECPWASGHRARSCAPTTAGGACATVQVHADAEHDGLSARLLAGAFARIPASLRQGAGWPRRRLRRPGERRRRRPSSANHHIVGPLQLDRRLTDLVDGREDGRCLPSG